MVAGAEMATVGLVVAAVGGVVAAASTIVRLVWEAIDRWRERIRRRRDEAPTLTVYSVADMRDAVRDADIHVRAARRPVLQPLAWGLVAVGLALALIGWLR